MDGRRLGIGLAVAEEQIAGLLVATSHRKSTWLDAGCQSHLGWDLLRRWISPMAAATGRHTCRSTAEYKGHFSASRRVTGAQICLGGIAAGGTLKRTIDLNGRMRSSQTELARYLHRVDVAMVWCIKQIQYSKEPMRKKRIFVSRILDAQQTSKRAEHSR